MCTYKFTLKNTLSYCTMTRMSTMESYYPFTYMYCPSRSYVCIYNEQDGCIRSTMESYRPFIYMPVHYSTVHPVLYYTMDKYYGILLSIYIYMYICKLSYCPIGEHP